MILLPRPFKKWWDTSPAATPMVYHSSVGHVTLTGCESYVESNYFQCELFLQFFSVGNNMIFSSVCFSHRSRVLQKHVYILNYNSIKISILGNNYFRVSHNIIYGTKYRLVEELNAVRHVVRD